MQAVSCHSQAADAYRAGLSLGEQLKVCQPEVVFLFMTSYYADRNSVVEGLYDGIGSDEFILLGTTCGGFYESASAGDAGVSALGINSGGEILWQAVVCQDAQTPSSEQVGLALKQFEADSTGGTPSLYFLFSNIHADASEIEKVLSSHTAAPVIGGLASSSQPDQSPELFYNKTPFTNAVILLAASGDFKFDIALCTDLSTTGKTGVVTEANGQNIYKVDDESALDFIEQALGRPVLQSDQGFTVLTVQDPKLPGIRKLRSVVPGLADREGAIGLYCGIETGSMIQVSYGNSRPILDKAEEVMARMAQVRTFQPAAVFIVSCMGRQLLLGEQAAAEVHAMMRGNGRTLPMAGFASMGEFSPLPLAQGYSQNLFHNMTMVALTLGT